MTAARKIALAGHDPSWGERFRRERDRLWEALRRAGAARGVVAIEHVGSTAVPGLAAKPIIDLLVGIRRFPPPPEFVEALRTLGYHHHGEAGVAGRGYFTDARTGEPRTRHLHAVEVDSWFWREHLRFRDRLRSRPDEAAAYEALKRDLARRHPHDPGAYTDGKTRFVYGLLALARAEAGVTGVHPAAAAGFEAGLEAYERSRPGYPPGAVADLVDRLGLAPGRRVVDVGAGSGRLTTRLLASGADVVAVEPVAGMRRALCEALGESLRDVEVAEGIAEELPPATGSVQAVVTAQAFHWFDVWAALSEFHRVLADGGRVALVWNVRDQSVDWMARWTAIFDRVSGGAPRERESPWRDAVMRTALFDGPETRTFPNPHVLPRETVVERAASVSFVAALDDHRRAEVLDEIRRLLDTHPQTRDDDLIAVPYRAEVHVLQRVP